MNEQEQKEYIEAIQKLFFAADPYIVKDIVHTFTLEACCSEKWTEEAINRMHDAAAEAFAEASKTWRGGQWKRQ